MIILDSATSVLRARLSAAPATTNPVFVFGYGEEPLGSAQATHPSAGAFNGTTNVSLVTSPAASISRVIKSGSIYNADSAAVTVIVEYYDGTTARQIGKYTINAGSTLVYGDNGFSTGGGGAAAVWGAITGTLTDQSDLATALANASTWGNLTGTLFAQTDLASALSGKVATGSSPSDWIVALGDETTALTTGTAKVTIRAARALTLTKIKASLTTASSSGNPAFDVKKNGTSLFSTTLTIDATEKTSETAATPAVLSTTAISADDELTFDITTAGTGAAGAKITLVATA